VKGKVEPMRTPVESEESEEDGSPKKKVKR